MDGVSQSEPTTRELIAKALEADVIDQEFAEELQNCSDLEEALGMFYTYIIEQGNDPDSLLAEWGVIEPDDASEDEPTANRLLCEGTDVSYDRLMGELQPGEVLVATWLRDPLNMPNVCLVADADEVASIVASTVHGYYVNLRWFASVTGSENPIDYGMFN